MSEVLPSQKSDLLSILIRAALVGMLVQPETVPTEGSDEFVCPTARTPVTGLRWLYGLNSPLDYSDPTGRVVPCACETDATNTGNPPPPPPVVVTPPAQTSNAHPYIYAGRAGAVPIGNSRNFLQDVKDFAIGFGGAVLGAVESAPPIGTFIDLSKWLDPYSPERQEMGLFLNNGHPSWDSYEQAANYGVGVDQNEIIATVKNWQAHPFQLVGALSVVAVTATAGGLRTSLATKQSTLIADGRVAMTGTGTFKIVDWAGYPDSNPPQGPFRLRQGEDKQNARGLANKTNRQIHNQAGDVLDGIQIHEPHPVKFGGSPSDAANKIGLPGPIHSTYTVWWNGLQRQIERDAGSKSV